MIKLEKAGEKGYFIIIQDFLEGQVNVPLETSLAVTGEELLELLNILEARENEIEGELRDI